MPYFYKIELNLLIIKKIKNSKGYKRGITPLQNSTVMPVL